MQRLAVFTGADIPEQQAEGPLQGVLLIGDELIQAGSPIPDQAAWAFDVEDPMPGDVPVGLEAEQRNFLDGTVADLHAEAVVGRLKTAVPSNLVVDLVTRAHLLLEVLVKKWWWVVLLAGCQQAPGPVATGSVTPAPVAVSVSATPVAVASATPVAGASPASSSSKVEMDLNGAVRATADFVHLGMTNQARCDMLVAHLNAAGKNQLWVTWEVYPAAAGVFEVTYVIEPLSNLTDGKKPTTGKRGNPFDRPRRVHSNGIYLEWLYDSHKKTCTARSQAASTLMELRPSLDGLEAALPAAWRTAAATPVVVADEPVVVPTAPASVEPVATGSSEPIQFTGFMGSGSGRRAVLTQSGETFAVGPGDKVGAYKVKSVAEDELELAQGEDTVRLMPGQVWTP